MPFQVLQGLYRHCVMILMDAATWAVFLHLTESRHYEAVPVEAQFKFQNLVSFVDRIDAEV